MDSAIAEEPKVDLRGGTADLQSQDAHGVAAEDGGTEDGPLIVE